MKVLIAYPTLNSLGGAQRLCVHLMKALAERDFRVTLATLDKTNWTALRKVFAESFRPDDEFYLLSRMPEIPTLTLRQAFMAIAYILELLLITLKGDYDLLINMGGEVIDSMGDIVYINAIPLKLMHVYPRIQPTHAPQWRCYSRLYGVLTRVFGNHNSVIVTNSTSNQEIVRKHLGRTPLVVHPAVDVKRVRSSLQSERRGNVAVTLSRFRSAKDLEIIPGIAKRAEKCRFILIGTADKDSEECLEEIFRRTEDFGVQDRVQILKNRPFSLVLEKLSTAKVFLHTQSYEAFGMAVVEAMAAGCVPVVPRYGGPWFDVLAGKQGRFGFSYGTPAEAAEIINLLLTDEGLRSEVSARASARANAFDCSVFERKMVDIVQKTGAEKLSRGLCGDAV